MPMAADLDIGDTDASRGKQAEMLIFTAIAWGTIGKEDEGLGGWLEGIRSREMFGPASYFRARGFGNA